MEILSSIAVGIVLGAGGVAAAWHYRTKEEKWLREEIDALHSKLDSLITSGASNVIAAVGGKKAG